MNLHRLYVGTAVEGQQPFKGHVVEAAALDVMLDHGLSGATFTWADGYWGGKRESTLVVEVVCSPDTARGMALDLAARLSQDCIQVASLTGDVTYVEARHVHEHEAARDAYLSAQE